jgi:hypothetical protein
MTTLAQRYSSSVQIRIPAKAMLFGEYGVLRGGPALVATLVEPCFEMVADLVSTRSSGAAVEFSSDYFQQPLEFDGRAQQLSGDSGAAALFIENCLKELVHQISEWTKAELVLRIKVTKSFASELGLGSSSAIISGLVWLCDWASHQARVISIDGAAKLFYQPRVFDLAWPQLHGCLLAAQGKGSGYDVAVQYASIEILGSGMEFSPSLWSFQPSGAPALERIVNRRFWQMAGFMLPSGVAAATGAILKNLSGTAASETYAQQHAGLALEAIRRLRDESLWVESKGLHPLADLLSSALAIAQLQGIAGHVERISALSLLPPGTVYKTMGAGFGDCIWCCSGEMSSVNDLPAGLPHDTIPLFAGKVSP